MADLSSLTADQLAEKVRDEVGVVHGYKDGSRHPGPDEARASLAELVRRLTTAEAALKEVREAVASALTSLSTGPGKDGYAYSVLDAALITTTTEDKP